MKIITISREFGSGGRELGKRLSDLLGFDYYDKEIISRISEETGLQENYIEKNMEQGLWQNIPLVFRRSFYMPTVRQSVSTELMIVQTKVIREIAKTNRDVVIVGRCADTILKEYNPLKVFVYADMPSKIKRCLERADKNEQLSEAEIAKKIRRIDDERSKARAIISSGQWGQKEEYHLLLNTSNLDIKELTTIVANYAKLYFGE